MAEKPEDLNLPIAIISRIIKDSLPENVSVSKEAKIAISKAASIFVLAISTNANDYALRNKRKTLLGADIINAVKDMDFDENFLQELSSYQKTAERLEAKSQDALQDTEKEESATPDIEEIA